jgi:endonuclease YncB( thermonuclease family)
MGQGSWGRTAKQHLARILPDRVELIVRDTDRYGRRVGEIFPTDEGRESINLQMVRAGQAAVYAKYCRRGSYFGAENEARKRRLGIWQMKGEHQTPWRWRHAR